MMSEQTIREQFLKIAPALTAWGQYVQTSLSQLTHEILKSSNHIQIDATYRVKDIGSYCDKAICRYPSENPIKDITDKVGARIVLLNKEDVKIVTERRTFSAENNLFLTAPQNLSVFTNRKSFCIMVLLR